MTLLRAAAKNHARVVILSDPKDYNEFLSQWKSGNDTVSEDFRKRMAVKVRCPSTRTPSIAKFGRPSPTPLPTIPPSPTTSVANTHPLMESPLLPPRTRPSSSSALSN